MRTQVGLGEGQAEISTRIAELSEAVLDSHRLLRRMSGHHVMEGGVEDGQMTMTDFYPPSPHKLGSKASSQKKGWLASAGVTRSPSLSASPTQFRHHRLYLLSPPNRKRRRAASKASIKKKKSTIRRKKAQ
jgi:hypothetical protein